MQAVLPVTDLVGAESATLAYPARSRAEEQEEEESEGEDEDAISVPYNPNGMVFLRRIQVGEEINVPRMRAGGPFLTAPAFKFHFGCALEDIKNKYHTVGIISRQTVAKTRIVTNKTRSTPTYVNFSSEPEPTLFSLAEHGHRLPPPPVDGGSDVESEEEGDGFSGSIDAQVSQMWRQFLIDVAVKTPNPRGATSSSYFTVSKGERLSVGEELYKNNMLSDMWRACQYKIGSKDDWKRAFDHLFPPPDRETSKTVQNYTQCKYFIKWKEIAGTADKSSVDAIRKSIWKKLYALAWIPHACQDKMWPTSQTAPGFTRLPSESTGPAPRILVKQKPRWQLESVENADNSE
jgi:hypothetical protein